MVFRSSRLARAKKRFIYEEKNSSITEFAKQVNRSDALVCNWINDKATSSYLDQKIKELGFKFPDN